MARSALRAALRHDPSTHLKLRFAKTTKCGCDSRTSAPAFTKKFRHEIPFDWLDGRTGYRKIAHEALYENVPGGARWRYVWGSTLTFTLAVQFITGIFLWMAYNPSSQTAWESVYYIQYEMTGGWLLRNISITSPRKR